MKIYEREVMFAQVDREIEKDMINLDNELIPSIFNTEKYEYVILSIIKWTFFIKEIWYEFLCKIKFIWA